MALSMTRMCRAQYERDDILEADILCNGHHREGSRLQDPEAQDLIGDISEESSAHDASKSPHRGAHFLTWKLPAWVDFSYSSIHQRTKATQRRLPNPFGPHPDADKEPEATSSAPLAIHETKRIGLSPLSASPEPESPTEVVTKVTPDGYPWNMPETTTTRDPGVMNLRHDTVATSRPVIPHPPPAPWDDQAFVDLPYDNPFYIRTIDNVLWLLRNPMGVLNLDDTVDLRVAISVEVPAGRLGTWLGLDETASPEEQIPPAGPSGDLTPRLTAQRSPFLAPVGAPEIVDGTEDIDLPAVIARRVKAKEGGVAQAVRPRRSSVLPRKATGGTGAMSLSLQQRRPTLSDADAERPSFAATVGRAAGAGTALSLPTVAGRARSASYVSALTLGTPTPPAEVPRAVSTAADEFGARPDAHAQADFVAANISSSRLSLGGAPRLARSQNVSTATAIFHEVLEEERAALRDRIEEEASEATKMQQTKSWLTSWMFKTPSKE